MDPTELYIRQAALERGIDPDIAVRVARSEGLAPGVWQSIVKKNGIREPSYGPFQLLVGGQNGFPRGMGNDFIDKTGLDPSDPSTLNQQINFALDQAKIRGWSPWFGAAKAGIQPWQGIKPGGAPVKAPEAILGADRRMEHQAQIPATPVDAAAPMQPVAAQQPVSPIAGMLSGFMQGFSQPMAGPAVKQDDSGQVSAMAAGLAEKAKQLKGAFLPDAAGLASLGKRQGVVV